MWCEAKVEREENILAVTFEGDNRYKAQYEAWVASYCQVATDTGLQGMVVRADDQREGSVRWNLPDGLSPLRARVDRSSPLALKWILLYSIFTRVRDIHERGKFVFGWLSPDTIYIDRNNLAYFYPFASTDRGFMSAEVLEGSTPTEADDVWSLSRLIEWCDRPVRPRTGDLGVAITNKDLGKSGLGGLYEHGARFMKMMWTSSRRSLIEICSAFDAIDWWPAGGGAPRELLEFRIGRPLEAAAPTDPATLFAALPQGLAPARPACADFVKRGEGEKAAQSWHSAAGAALRCEIPEKQCAPLLSVTGCLGIGKSTIAK
jgi:hypothetical protein